MREEIEQLQSAMAALSSARDLLATRSSMPDWRIELSGGQCQNGPLDFP